MKNEEKGMTEIKQQKTNSRRNFLQGSAIAAASVAVATSGVSTQAVAVPQVTKEPAKQEGYRLTKHIVDYYKSAAS